MKKLILLFLLISYSCADSNNSVVPDIVISAKSQIGKTIIYDPSYKRLAYPNGDIDIQDFD